MFALKAVKVIKKFDFAAMKLLILHLQTLAN